MSAQTDLNLNEKAEALAIRATEWIGDNRTVQAVERSSEEICRYEYEDRIIYVQKPDDINLKFGHIVMRQGHGRGAGAAAADFRSAGGVQWALCAVSDHPESATAELARHVTLADLVHEATHYIDFLRTGYKPAPFGAADKGDLTNKYYNTPHEFNAFFHQGLYIFKNDFCLIHLVGPHDRRYSLRHLTSDAYWPSSFINRLNRKYRRKAVRRYVSIYAHLLSQVSLGLAQPP